MDIYNFAQSTLNKIVVFTQSGAQNDIIAVPKVRIAKKRPEFLRVQASSSSDV
jgi:hypothetical protein